MLYLVPRVLIYSDILGIKSLCNIKYHNVGINSYLIFEFSKPTRFDIFKLNKLNKLEAKYFNTYITSTHYCCKFIIRPSDSYIFESISTLGIHALSGDTVDELLTFLNKKAPATVKLSRFSLF